MRFLRALYTATLFAFAALVHAQSKKGMQLKSGKAHWIASVTGPNIVHSDEGSNTPIKTLSPKPATRYETWKIEGSPEAGYTFKNIGTGGFAYSTGDADKQVISSKGSKTAWALKPLGNHTWTISYPSKDLLWTFKGANEIVSTTTAQSSGDTQKWYIWPVPNFAGRPGS